MSALWNLSPDQVDDIHVAKTYHGSSWGDHLIEQVAVLDRELSSEHFANAVRLSYFPVFSLSLSTSILDASTFLITIDISL